MSSRIGYDHLELGNYWFTGRKLGIEYIVLNIPVYRRRYFRPEEYGLRR